MKNTIKSRFRLSRLWLRAASAVLALVFAVHNAASAQTTGTVSDATAKIDVAAFARAEGSVPRFIRFAGTLRDAKGEPLHGVAGLEFAIYKDREGGSPVWMEVQNVEFDEQGRYTALIGVTTNEGISPDLLSSGEPRWLSVRAVGGEEQPRMLLVSVPYALKAADADTLGGKPASAYMLSGDRASSAAEAASGNPASTASPDAPHLHHSKMADSKNAVQSDSPNSAVLGTGTTNFVPIWIDSHTIGNSVIFQTGGNVGVGTTTPGATLDSVGAGIAVRGTSSSANGIGVFGNNTATSGYATGVYGQSASGTAVAGVSTATSGVTTGVYGQTANNGFGVFGNSIANTSGFTSGVFGQAPTGTGVFGTSDSGVGVGGMANATSGGPALGVWGDSLSTSGSGVAGYADATSGNTSGVYGQSASTNGSGVLGLATAASGFTTGVSGQSASPDGVGGNFVNASGSGGAGVIGYVPGTSGSPTGGFFQADSTAAIGAFGNATANSGSTLGVVGQIFSPNGTAGLFQDVSGQGLLLRGSSGSSFTTVFSVDAAGNLDISGNLTVGGSKSARVKMPDGRDVALYAVESPENWFEDFGTAQLQGGVAQVSLDPGFLQTVDTAAGYHVFLTPNGDCHGLYVAGKTQAGFEVRELSGGNANITFDYRIVAHRLGFENARLQVVHPPQTSSELKARLASRRAVAQITARPSAPLPKPPAKIMIPQLPHP